MSCSLTLGSTEAAAYIAAKNPVIPPGALRSNLEVESLQATQSVLEPSHPGCPYRTHSAEPGRLVLLRRDGDLVLEFSRGVWSSGPRLNATGLHAFGNSPDFYFTSCPLLLFKKPSIYL